MYCIKVHSFTLHACKLRYTHLRISSNCTTRLHISINVQEDYPMPGLLWLSVTRI